MEKFMQAVLGHIDFNKLGDHPNIMLAAAFWEEERYRAAYACYRFMRRIDDMIDNRKSDKKTMDCLEKQAYAEKVKSYMECLEKGSSEDPGMQEIIATIHKFQIPLKLFHTFARSMLRDIDHTDFASYKDFIRYSEGASVAPASVFVHLCCLDRINGHYLAPSMDVMEVSRPCAIFSYLVHIMRDFRKDQAANLNYFPLDLLQQYGLTTMDLKRIAGGEAIPSAFRGLIREILEKAEVFRLRTLEQLDGLEGRISPRYMLSLYIIYNLYLQIYHRIDPDHGSFTTEELVPRTDEVKDRVLKVIREYASLLI